jgi:hypothetical protein
MAASLSGSMSGELSAEIDKHVAQLFIVHLFIAGHRIYGIGILASIVSVQYRARKCQTGPSPSGT